MNPTGFYTPFGVTWFGTTFPKGELVWYHGFLYAVWRDVVRNPTTVDGAVSCDDGGGLHTGQAEGRPGLWITGVPEVFWLVKGGTHPKGSEHDR